MKPYASFYWWIPLLGPVLGAIIGGATYNFLISDIWSCQNVESIPDQFNGPVKCCGDHETTVTTDGTGEENEEMKSVRNQNISA